MLSRAKGKGVTATSQVSGRTCYDGFAAVILSSVDLCYHRDGTFEERREAMVPVRNGPWPKAPCEAS